MGDKKHTFVICAYKESEYLEECIKSLINQTMKSNIIMCTSTPNKFIEELCRKYRIQLFINKGEKGITQDWNFAYNNVNTEYVTIAHQDDYYEPDYLKNIFINMESNSDCIIAFTDYYEIRNRIKVENNKILKIKRILNFPLLLSKKSSFIRKRILSLGNSICCPAVTFNKNNCGDFQFDNKFRVSCDWEAWSRLADKKGSFIYLKDKLMGHRIYEKSTTTEMIAQGIRYKEDTIIFERYWSKGIVKFLMKHYKKSMESNTLK